MQFVAARSVGFCVLCLLQPLERADAEVADADLLLGRAGGRYPPPPVTPTRAAPRGGCRDRARPGGSAGPTPTRAAPPAHATPTDTSSGPHRRSISFPRTAAVWEPPRNSGCFTPPERPLN